MFLKDFGKYSKIGIFLLFLVRILVYLKTTLVVFFFLKQLLLNYKSKPFLISFPYGCRYIMIFSDID